MGFKKGSDVIRAALASSGGRDKERREDWRGGGGLASTSSDGRLGCLDQRRVWQWGAATGGFPVPSSPCDVACEMGGREHGLSSGFVIFTRVREPSLLALVLHYSGWVPLIKMISSYADQWHSVYHYGL